MELTERTPLVDLFDAVHAVVADRRAKSKIARVESRRGVERYPWGAEVEHRLFSVSARIHVADFDSPESRACIASLAESAGMVAETAAGDRPADRVFWQERSEPVLTVTQEDDGHVLLVCEMRGALVELPDGVTMREIVDAMGAVHGYTFDGVTP